MSLMDGGRPIIFLQSIGGKMSQKGSHTWDLNLDYHLCPKCKQIFEDRQAYTLKAGRYVKEMKCPYCEHLFSASKANKAHWSLFSGADEFPEWDWPESR
jgi:uncharacterized C2H2 Zn-finger protein